MPECSLKTHKISLRGWCAVIGASLVLALGVGLGISDAVQARDKKGPLPAARAAGASSNTTRRVLRFPEAYTSGKLCILKDDDSEIPLAVARGAVMVDPRDKLILFGSYDLMNRKDGFASLPENAISKLHLRGIEATDGKPFSLAGIERQQSMTFLYDEEAEITEESLRDISKLVNLRRLSLRYCGITAKYLDACLALPKLVSLDLSLNSICKDAWLAVGKMKRLTTLKAGNTGVNDFAMSQIANLTELGYLNLRGDKEITSVGWANLVKLSKLHTIDVADTTFSGRDAVKLRSLPLKRVVLNLKNFNPSDLTEFRKAHPNVLIEDSGHVDKGTDYLFAPLH